MITYQEYKNNGGTLSEVEFNQLLPKVRNLFDLYIKSNIPSWRVKPLEEYGMSLTTAFVEQIDFVSHVGGLNALSGRSDYNIKSVAAGGISLSLDKGEITMFMGIPFAPLTIASLSSEMRRIKLLSRLL